MLTIVPLHPPKFYRARDFLVSYDACGHVQRRAMSIAIVFSSREDHHAFAGTYSESCLLRVGASCNLSQRVGALVLDRPIPHESNAVIWKKWYACATLLDQGTLDSFMHVALIDAESLVLSCAALPWLPSRSEQQHAEGTSVYAAPIRNRDRAYERYTSLIVMAAAMQVVRNQSEMQTLARALRNFSLYPWWSDMPTLPVHSLRNLISHWRERPTFWAGASKGALPTNASFREIVSAYHPGKPAPSPLALSIRKYTTLFGPPRAFEGVVTVLWQVLRAGLVVVGVDEALRQQRVSDTVTREIDMFWLEVSDAECMKLETDAHALQWPANASIPRPLAVYCRGVCQQVACGLMAKIAPHTA